jgi:hypothetical protein
MGTLLREHCLLNKLSVRVSLSQWVLRMVDEICLSSDVPSETCEI